MRGGSTGILLIHGFTGLPAELFLLGEFLNGAGFTVLGARLAGHGTSEQDLMRTTREDWLNSALDGYEILRGLCEKIFVVGHSMGALLTLKLSTLRDAKKIVTLAAPIFVDEEQGLEKLPPREMCGNFCVVKPRRKLKNVPPAVNKVYRQMPLISIHELVDLIAETTQILPKVKAPILIMHGDEDHTAQPKSADFIAEKIGSKKIRCVNVPNCGHLLPLTDSREFVFAEVLRFLNGA